MHVYNIIKTHLDPPSMEPLSAPTVEQATNMGIMILKLPNVFSAKVCKCSHVRY